MKITIVAPKTITNDNVRFDYAFWNFYIPLLELGYKVTFFDTCIKGNKDLKDHIEINKPDLLLCIMTGSNTLCPDEPWETISKETAKGNIKTFNWFCDDSYRFDSFSKNVCNLFHYCSTPEKKYINNYINIGYKNIVYSTWHVNYELYNSCRSPKKDIDISFIGGLHGDRVNYLNYLISNNIKIFVPNTKVSFEDMISIFSRSKICLNFTKDSSLNNTQMKARLFEVPATRSLLMSEYTDDILNCFDHQDLLLFNDKEELLSKISWALTNDISNICDNGFNKVKTYHDSKIRLSKLLEDIK